ncbi:serine/threonine protein kinase [Komagataeibacter saccharivorans]|uniref:serine/threonine protein kinase n=1 Tax=Komagataeibacter saccharivorans TaxID=265959 RepID=UPI0015E0E82C|nr:serine/threonine-protein kinase [Komagataeibacter saccharivorans]
MTLTLTTQSAASNLGTPLRGRFMLLPEVRSGGMGEVQKALDLQTSQFVAVKRMKLSGDQLRSKASFEREVEALEHLDHPNIVKSILVDQDESGRWFLAMEWIERNLETYILEKGHMNWARFAEEIGDPLLRAIEYAQVSRNLVHRDLNPRNILVTDAGVPKITDYGISKVLDDRNAWMPVAGRTFVDARTAGFSPKEADDRVHSRRRDCFSFAAIGVFCLVGRRINGDDDLFVAMQEAPLPDGVRPVIERALSDDPMQRPVDARALRMDVDFH